MHLPEALLRIVGTRVRRRDVDARLAALDHMRDTHYHLLPGTTHGGWYRHLSNRTTLGFFATAQMLLVMAREGRPVDALRPAFELLIDGQRPDGGWNFITTEPRSAIDTTSWAISALSAHRIRVEAMGLDATKAIDAGIIFLEKAALSGGGWGLVAKSTWRAYSTALAVRALLGSGMDVLHPLVRGGAQSLASHADPTFGAWRDTQGRLSLAATAAAVVALSMYNVKNGHFESELSRARAWLVGVRGPDHWGASSSLANDEEVSYTTSKGRPHRIEYRFTRRPLALTAVATGGLSPTACSVAREILVGLEKDDVVRALGSASEVFTSWSLFDCQMALLDFVDLLPTDWTEVWWTRGRLKVRRARDHLFVTILRRYWPVLLALGTAVALVWALNVAGITEGLVNTVLFIVTTLFLSILANVITPRS